MKFNKITLLLAIMIISILAVGAVSAESVDDATISADDGDLSVATADSEISDVSAVAEDAVDNNPLGEPKTIDINDDTYSTYFDENGMLDSVSDYDTLVVGTLTGKDLKVNKSVTITGNGEGVINNGTITLVDYNAEGTSISGLTINNVNKNAFYIGDLVTNVTIKDNAITIYGDDTTTEYSINGIFTQGFISDIDIINNTISLSGNFSYMNGFYSSVWDASYNPITTNPGLISLINNTISIDATSTSGSQQGIYFDTFVDSIAQGNVIDIKVTGDTYAYGISLSDSSYSATMADAFDDDYDPTQVLQAPNNITFDGNNITLSTPYMAYGIEAVSLGPLDYDDLDDDGDSYYAEFDNVTITNNNIKAVSERGVYGIVVGGIGDSLISNNYVDVSGSSAEGITSSDMLGEGTAAIAVVMPRSTGKFVSELTISNNIIDFQVSGITVDDDREDVTIENNHILRENGAIIVNDDTYQYLFDEEGNFVYETEDGTTILVDTLTNKNMIFSQPLNIKSKDDSSVITNGTITLTADASGSVIDGLTFDYTGASNLITLADGISDVTVSNNIIKFNSTGRYAAAIAAANWEYGPISNMKIVSNKIDVICENAAAYAIDVAGGWGQKTVTDSLISQNNITIQANGMAEAIYVCSASNFNITENNITATSEAGASYGIAADNSDNIGITGNTIDSTSKQAAYGIANTHNADNTISDNKITVEGASAIGVGVGFDTGSVIEGNTIDVNASDDYASTPTSDSALRTGNSGIKLTNNATATISNNFVSSNGAQMDLDGASADTNVGTNYVAMTGNPEDVLSPVATTISVASATVTADPNGAGKTRNIAITVKDANGKAVADQTLKVYVNGALKTVKTNADGVATLAVAYKAAGTTTLVASFDGATGVLGSSAVGKLTVKKNAVKIAAKTKKVKKSKAKKAKVKITLKVGKTALKKKAVTIKINKKTYKAKTNAKGIVTFKVKLPKKAKKYKYTVKFAGDNFNKAKTFKGKLTVK